MFKYVSPPEFLIVVLLVCGPAVSVVSQGLSAGMALSDVAEIRKKAEAGDATAEAAFGDTLSFKMRCADALRWYRQAALQGNVKAQAHVAGMLLWGCAGNPSDQTVHPDRAEGIRWAFMAATNHDRGACGDMSAAFARGWSVEVDLVAAYAWLEYGSPLNHWELNDLALKMSTADVERAKKLAAEFNAGNWQYPALAAIADPRRRIKLMGITAGQQSSLAIINGQTLSEGQVVTLDMKPGTITLKCLKIEKVWVLVSIDGEVKPTRLELGQ